MTNAVKQVIATDKDGAKLSPEQLADAGVKPGDRAVIEIRPYTKRDFERDDVDRVYDTVEGFTELARGLLRAARRRAVAAMPTNGRTTAFLRLYAALRRRSAGGHESVLGRRGGTRRGSRRSRL